MLLGIFTEITGDKDDVDNGKESDEQSRLATEVYTFCGIE